MKQFSVIVFFICSVVVHAENYRITKPSAWEATTTTDAVKELYGYNKNMTQNDNRVVIVAPKFSTSRGLYIPIKINTEIPAKSIAVFQNANVHSLEVVFSIYDNTILPYEFVIFMRQAAWVTVVVEGKDGRLYSNNIEIDVSSCTGTSISEEETVSMYNYELKLFMSEVEKSF